MANKRFHGEGTVSFNPKRNNYEARFSYLDPKTGKTKRKSFSALTAREAVSRGKQWKKEVENGLLPNFEKITLWEWLKFWLDNYAKNKVREKTFAKYESCLRCYIKPSLGNMQIRKLTGVQVQHVLNELLEKGGKGEIGISTSTINATRKYLRAALDQAQKDGVVKKNVVEGTVALKNVKSEINILTFEQSNELIRVSKNFKLEYGQVPFIFIVLALETGMRFGELIGLKWDCVDLENGLIYVKRTINTSKPSLNFQDTKTAKSRRQISLMESTIRALKIYRAWQNAHKEKLGDKYHENDLVITNIFGNVLHPSNFTRRIFKPLLKKVGISESFRAHDLRHTHASQLLMSGVNPKIVQERMGHATVAMTLNTYSHLLPNLQGEAIKSLEKTINFHVKKSNEKECEIGEIQQ
ncbi:tyrosine-type recombinase/integrase [Anaerosinus gibii]|uniref:Site-specific integrase n=1 Tax=Selenobaculum gibii TaxID=3054208 RepID=A0A9Y2EUW5_9FIRM|nr:site-specific integrase [Selenobaculum gbiensis]WIW69859.1 site-specific integrase [Selenobaculum gbiensis]